ncbi:MAG: oligosaccharide flippase family protein [Gemmatimonadaceae bacterium]
MRSVLWNWSSFAFSVAVTFVLSPFIVRELGDTNYGIWVLVGSLVGYLGLLDFGVRSAVTRYVARLHTGRSDQESSRLVSTALSIFGSLGLTALLASSVFAVLLGHRFHIPPSELGTARLVVVLGGLTMTSSLVSGAFGGVVVGLQRFDVSSKLEIVLGALQALAIWLVLRDGGGIAGLALIQLVTSTLRTIALAALAFRLYPELTIEWFAWNRQWAREIFSFSLFSTLITFSTTLILYSDSLVIGVYLPAAEITLFSIAASLTDYARNLIRGISTTMTPKASATELTGAAAIAAVTVRATRFATLLLLPIGVTFWLRGAAFIGLWMGPHYAAASGAVLRILTLAMVFYAASQVLGASLLGLSRHNWLVPVFIAEAVINLALSILLVQRMGLVGIAWGTTVPNLVTSVVVFPWLARRLMGVPLRTYYFESWLRPLVAMAPFAAGTLLVERYWQAGNLASYFVGVLLVMPLAAAGAWAVALDPDERQMVVALARRGFGAGRAAAESAP